MPFQISIADLKTKANSFTYANDGDIKEIQFGPLLNSNFSNSQIFWKKFVTPTTERIEKGSGKFIQARPTVDPTLQHLTSIHYSVFLNLAYAHLCLIKKQESYFENFYAHLGSVCDLAEDFLMLVYLVKLDCNDEKSHILVKLPKDEFIEKAKEWYDQHYHLQYEHYLNKGKFASMKLPKKSSVIHEYFGKKDQNLKEYLNTSNQIRAYRNVVVHNAFIGSWIVNGKAFVPKSSEINKYRTWHDIWKMGNQGFLNDFVERDVQMKNDLQQLEERLNSLWVKPIEDFENLLYNQTNPVMAGKYALELS